MMMATCISHNMLQYLLYSFILLYSHAVSWNKSYHCGIMARSNVCKNSALLAEKWI